MQFHLEALYVKGDQRPQSPVLKYSLIYARNLADSRWLVEGGVSYTNRYVREQFTPFQSFFSGDRSQLVAADLTFMYNLLRSNRHAFRIGAGLSLWYTRDGVVENLMGTTTVGGQQLADISFTRNYSHTYNLALALRSSYEYSLTSRVVVGVRASTGGNMLPSNLLTSNLVGTLSTVGLSAGYRF
ncbi:hypothetical protein [Spirosoma flavum]|uniref:Outer membrane beta-barrel protein n=1 Tax=Spirosoma flavum TaxID=2048557 RepID=A0ABW6AS32_9BACT